MIFEAISKTGSLGFCFVCMDIGSSERLASTMQNLQIPDTAETRITYTKVALSTPLLRQK